MGSDDDMFRIWSGPEGSSHKEPLSGIRIHRAHGRFLVPRFGPAGGEVFGSRAIPQAQPRTSETPNTSPPVGPRRPKITRRGRITLIKSIPRVVLLAGRVKTSVAMWFKRRRCCCLIFCS